MSLASIGRHCIIRADAGYMATMLERADKLAAIHDDLAAHDGRHRPTRDLEPFIRRIVGALVQVGRRDRRLLCRIPDRNISVRPYRDRPFARMKPVHFGAIGPRDATELVERDPAFDDAL